MRVLYERKQKLQLWGLFVFQETSWKCCRDILILRPSHQLRSSFRQTDKRKKGAFQVKKKREWTRLVVPDIYALFTSLGWEYSRFYVCLTSLTFLKVEICALTKCNKENRRHYTTHFFFYERSRWIIPFFCAKRRKRNDTPNNTVWTEPILFARFSTVLSILT